MGEMPNPRIILANAGSDGDRSWIAAPRDQPRVQQWRRADQRRAHRPFARALSLGSPIVQDSTVTQRANSDTSTDTRIRDSDTPMITYPHPE